MPKFNSVTDVVETYRRYRTLYERTLRPRQVKHEGYYWCSFDTGLDRDHFRQPHILPRARMLVENPVNNIAMDKVTVGRQPLLKPPAGLETKGSQEQADKIERWAQALLDQGAQEEPYYLREIIKNLCLRGEAYRKLTLLPQGLRDPEANGSELFRFTCPDSGNIMASLDTDSFGRPVEVFEERAVTVRHCRQLVEDWHPGEKITVLSGLADDELVNLVEWWTPLKRGYIAMSQGGAGSWALPIDKEEIVDNPLGFVPYVRGYSGYGKWPPDGDPGYLAVGILTGWEQAIVGETRLMTMLDTITAKHALPSVTLKVPEGVEIDPGDVDLGPGAVWLEEHGIEYKVQSPPEVPPGILQQLTRYAQMFEAFQPGVVSGAYERGGEAAIGRSQRLTQASLVWEPMYISAKKLIGASVGMAFQALERVVNASVELRGLKLRPEDIDGRYQVDISIEPGNPEERRFNYLLGKDLKGFLPQRLIIEDLFGEADATQFMAELLAEQAIFNDPQNLRLIFLKAMEELGMEEELKDLESRYGGIAKLQAKMPAGPESEGGRPVSGPPGIGGSPTRGVMPLPGVGQVMP